MGNGEKGRFFREREIKLSELLWKIILSWRTIIALAVIFAILAAGYSYLQSKRQVSASNEAGIGPTLTDEEAQDVARAQTIQRYLQERKDYQEDSVYINLDAYNVNVVKLQYYIDADSVNDNKAGVLMDSYRGYIESNVIVEDMQRTSDIAMDDLYIGELIRFTNYDIDMEISLQTLQEQMMRLEGSYDRIMIVNVMGENAKEAGILADAVEKALTAYGKKLSGQIADHELMLLSRYESVEVDTSVAAEQENLQASIETLQTRLTNATANFTEDQKAALEAEETADVNDEENVSEEQTVTAPGVSKKYVLLGIVLGVVLAVIWETLKYILDGRVKSAEELQRMSGIRILGTVRGGDSGKRLFSGIDDRIRSLKERPCGTPEEQMEVLLANIALSCRKEGITKVFLTSESMDEDAKEKIQALISQLAKNGVEAVYETNIAYNAMSLEHMSKIGNVVIVVKEDHTQYKELEKELSLCMDQEMNVLGAVFLG